MRDRERLIARIRQIRRTPKLGDVGSQPSPAELEQGQLRALETRLEHLEAMVQGLQDSVHRESSRQEKRIAELETRIQPGAIGKALSEDARERGL